MSHPTQEELSETVAYVALRRLQSRYADIVTRRSFEELHDIMLPDMPVVVDTLQHRIEIDGPAEMGRFIAKQLEQYSFFEFVILNTVMKIDAEAGTATARMYMQELRQGVSDGRRTDAYGVYHDAFERGADGQWRFARRRYQSFSRTAEPGEPFDQHVFDVPVIALEEV